MLEDWRHHYNQELLRAVLALHNAIPPTTNSIEMPLRVGGLAALIENFPCVGLVFLNDLPTNIVSTTNF